MKKFSKIIGWSLIFLGVLIILWTVFTSYRIFALKSELPKFFVEKQEEVSQPGLFLDIQEEINRIVGDQIKDMLPDNSFSRIFNLIVWSVLAGIFIFAGGQISNIGIKLIKVDVS